MSFEPRLIDALDRLADLAPEMDEAQIVYVATEARVGRPLLWGLNAGWSRIAVAVGAVALLAVTAAFVLNFLVNRPGLVGPQPTSSPAPSPIQTSTTTSSPQTTEPALSSIARRDGEVLRFTGEDSWVIGDLSYNNRFVIGDLIAVHAETGESRILLEDLSGIASASWSADGRWIAYKNTIGTLKVVGPDGVPVHLRDALSGDRAREWGFQWSPDGARLTYRDMEGQWEYDAETGLKTETDVDYGSGVSPDGTKSLYAWPDGGGAIHSVDVRTGEDSLFVQLTGENLESCCDFAWSPDGSRLAIGSDLNPGKARLFVMNGDGSGIRVVADDIALSGVEWSPDGTKLTFDEALADVVRIWVVNADGTTPTLIGSQPNQDEGGDPDGGGPVWSPEGSQIGFWTEPGTAFVIRVDGEGGVSPLDALTYEAWSGGRYECSTCFGHVTGF